MLHGSSTTNNSNTTELKTPTGRRQPVGYLQAWPRIWTRDDREQIQKVARAEHEPGTAGLRVQRADHLATLPPFYQTIIVTKKTFFLTSIQVSIFLSSIAVEKGQKDGPEK